MKSLFILPAWLIAGVMGYSQSMVYTYDDSGNRIERSITLKSTASSEKEDDSIEACNDEPGDLDIVIYPNPVKSELILEISGTEEVIDASISLFDQSGKLVLQENHITNTSILYLGDLMPGNYFMIIQTGERYTRWKIVKE